MNEKWKYGRYRRTTRWWIRAGLGVYFLIRSSELFLMAGETDWPNWRGPQNNGSSRTANPPISWSEKENIAWKRPLEGVGHSTPIVSGEAVYLTLASPVGHKKKPVVNPAPGAHDNFPVEQTHRFAVLAIDLGTGNLIWHREVARVFPHEGGHYTGSLASHSPVTDGERIYAFFGTRGLFALDRRGGVLWQKSFGRMETRHAHGEGSSPVLYEKTLIVNWDHEGQSMIAAVDTTSGEIRWQTNRDEMTSWSSPLVVQSGGKPQVIVSATKRVRSYDLESGEQIWECAGLARNVVASPVFHDGVVIVGNSYDKQAMMGIQLAGAEGDITQSSHVLWSLNRLTPYVPSPLIYDGTLYFLRHNQGVLSVLDPKTGRSRGGPFRLNGLRQIFASPVAAAGRIYITDRDGTTLVLSHEAEPKVLGINRLADTFSASPVLSGEALLLRGEKSLYCVKSE